MEFSEIPEILEDLKKGKMIVLVDAENEDKQANLVCAAEKITPEIINFMSKFGKGLICLPLPDDQAKTIRNFIADNAKLADILKPDRILPIRARQGGVLVRAGLTEAAVDLMELASLKPAAVICGIQLLEFCKEHQLKTTAIAKVIEYRLLRQSQIKRLDSVNLPTDYGVFKLIGYESITSAEPHLALCKGDIGQFDENGQPIEHTEPVLIRVHSECMTGDLFHSQRCECGYQLITAMKMIEKTGKGALVYLRQEGRGIGLANKLKAYKLQEQGLDTVDANLKLGFSADKRDYGIGAQILRDLGLKNIKILTNNPKKISRLEVYGIKITEQIPLLAEPNQHNIDYLKTKKYRFGHILDEDL